MNTTIEATPPARAWLPDMLTGLAMATGVGYIAATYTISRWLTRPSHGRPRQTPDAFGLDWEKLSCVTADRFRLAGWTVAPPKPRGTVVLFHGLRNNRTQTLGRCAFLAKAGYRCVAFDHRCHGESPGRRVSFGYYESRDVAAVLDLVRQRWPNQPQAALGISMGAAALCYGAPRVRSCQAVILESCYADIATAFVNRLNHGYPPWFRRLSRGVVWVTERRLGLRLQQLTPLEHVADLAPSPTLVLTGTDDAHATPEETKMLYERCQGPKEMWLVPRATHKDVFEVGGEAYRARVLDFLDRRLA